MRHRGVSGSTLIFASLERYVPRVLAGIAGFFSIAGLAVVGLVAIFGRERLHAARLLFLLQQFDLDAENNLPTFFSCFLLSTAGCLLLLIARRAREAGRPMVLHWRTLGYLFFALSFDEFAGIHEKVGDFLKANFHPPEHGVLRFSWVIAGLPFVAIVASLYLPFLLSLGRRLRNRMLLAGVVYVGGALGMEAVDGWYSDRYGENTTYALMTIVEETMEMSGAVLFIRCLLSRLGDDVGEVRLVLRAPARETGSVEPERETPSGESLRPWASSSPFNG